MSLNTTVPTNINDTYAVPSLPVENISNKEDKANKGIANGYAPLDGTGKVPEANLPAIDVSGQISTHNSATTSVHGIANTVDLATKTYADDAVFDHKEETTSIHGIANTADLVTTSNLATHTAVTTSIHGIANTANLVLTDDPRIVNIAGGSIDTSGAGGSINTRGTGSIGLGNTGTRTTLNGSASGGNKTITLPNATGTIALTSDSRFTDSRTPTTHKSSHATGGTDALSVSDIGAVAITDTRIANIRYESIDTRDGASKDVINGGNGGTILQVGGNAENGQIQTGDDDENGEPIYENMVLSGGNAGYLCQNGANGGDYGGGGSAGSIDTSAYEGHSGGMINTAGGELGLGGAITTNNGGGSILMYGSFGQAGGSLYTYAGGGSIDTRGTGTIQLGFHGNRTTLNGSAIGGNKTITLPNATGTIALTSDSRFTDARTPTSTLSHTHGNITNDGKVLVPYGGIISASAVDAFSGAGTYPMIQGSGVGGSIQVASNGAITIASAGTGYVDGLATRAGGSRFNLVTQSTQNASANLPVITTTGGNISAGSFGTTANTFCQGDDARLSNSRTPTSHTHGNITNDGKVGFTANLPLITTTNGAISAGTFGTTANTFCQGDDARLTKIITLKASNVDLGRTTWASNTSFYTYTNDTALVDAGFKVDGNYVVTEVKSVIKNRFTLEDGWNPRLTSAIGTTDTLFAVTMSALAPTYMSFQFSSGWLIKVDNEIMRLVGFGGSFLTLTGNSFLVVRGCLGTSVTAHSASAPIYFFEASPLFSSAPKFRIVSNASQLTSTGNFQFDGFRLSSSVQIGTRPQVGSIFREVCVPNASTQPEGMQIFRPKYDGNLQMSLYTSGSYLESGTTTALTTSSTSVSGAFIGWNNGGYFAKITSTAGSEIVLVTGNTANTALTIARAKAGTTALAHPSGAVISLNAGSTLGKLLADVYVTLEELA